VNAKKTVFSNLNVFRDESSISFNELIGPTSQNSLSYKFSSLSDETFQTCLMETLRFLYLASISTENSLFFPGDQIIDDMWHALVIETKEYKELCNKLTPGNFLDHSGIKYEDYSRLLSSEDLHNEQLSWLTSYVSNFGPISKEAFKHLILAQNMTKRLEINLEGLNNLGTKISNYLNKKNEFFIMKFPSSKTEILNFNLIKLTALQGTSSINLDFNKYLVKDSELLPNPVLQDNIEGSQKIRNPELGIAENLLAKMRGIINERTSPKTEILKKNIHKVESRLKALKTKKNDPSLRDTTQLRFEINEFIKNCFRVFVIVEGGNALTKASICPRLSSELMLLDVAAQPIELIEMKLNYLMEFG